MVGTDNYGSDDTMQKKWKAFCRKIDTKTDDFDAVLGTIKAFLNEPYTASVNSSDFHKHWSVSAGIWR